MGVWGQLWKYVEFRTKEVQDRTAWWSKEVQMQSEEVRLGYSEAKKETKAK